MSSKDIVLAAAGVGGGPPPPPSGDPYWNDVSLLTNSADNLIYADASTLNNPISIIGVVPPTLQTPFSGVGGSVFCKINIGYIAAANNAAFAASTGDFTVEGWFNFVDFAFARRVFSYGDYGVAGNLELEYDGTTFLVHLDGGYTGYSSTLSADTWYHIAVVRSAGDVTVYIDGTGIGTNTQSGSVGNSDAFAIGGYYAGGVIAGIEANAYISNFRYVVGTAVYTSTFTPPTSPLTDITGTVILVSGTQQNTFNNTNYYDQSNKMTVTPNNDVSYSGLSPYGNDYPGSLYLAGGDDYFQLDGTAMNLSTGTTAFTCEFWINPSRAGGWVITQPYTSAGYSLEIALTSTGLDDASGQYIGFGYYFGGWYYVSTIGVQDIPLNAWSHIACVFDGSNSYIYIDGVDCTVGTLTDWTNYGSSDFYYLGRRWDSSGVNNSIQGYISNFRFVNGTPVYTSNFTPPTAPLPAIANTACLLDADTGGFYDLSTDGESITQAGSVVITNQVSPFATVSESYYFDGSSNLAASVNTMPYGTEDFTVELWINLATGQLSVGDMGFILGANFGGGFGISNFGNDFVLYNSGYSGINFGAKTQISENTWNHLAITRSGDDYRLFINGTLDTSGVQTVTGISWDFGIFNAIGYGMNTQYMTGYLNNIRITRGVARYTTNFTAPTAPFPKSL